MDSLTYHHLFPSCEFENSAFLTAFGASGRAVVPAPSAIAREVCRHHRVAVVGRTAAVRERYFAISVDRRVKHAAGGALTNAAGTQVWR